MGKNWTIQWGSEYRTSLVFKWSKVVWSPNGPIFECHLNTRLNFVQYLEHHLNTGPLNTELLFEYWTSEYWTSKCSLFRCLLFRSPLYSTTWLFSWYSPDWTNLIHLIAKSDQIGNPLGFETGLVKELRLTISNLNHSLRKNGVNGIWTQDLKTQKQSLYLLCHQASNTW